MAELVIQNLVLGMVQTNVYLLQNRETKEMIVIDPADAAGRIIRKIDEMEGKPAAILLTHAHFDHIMAAEKIRDTYHIPIYLEESEEEVLEDPNLNLSGSLGTSVSLKGDILVRDGEELNIAGFAIQVLHTPGHTQGSCCYYFPEQQILFSGDTLFYGSHGRVDFATSSSSDMVKSIHRLLTELPDDVNVCPGHEMFTSIKVEKRINPLAP
ncbi:MAG: MBL fold metallo-hydrolase [Eubacterium sp.]|nr:MBL fold metallo-hydrolase [Eubacterium sp.]